MAIIPNIKYIFDRKHLAAKGIQGNIDLRITYNRKQKFIFTGVKCYPSQWNDNKQSITNSLDAMVLNEILAKMKTNVLKIINTMADSGSIDLDAIPTLLKNKSVDKTFTQYILERMKKKNVTEYTKKAYHVFYSRFLTWGKVKYFGDVTEKNIRDFDEYLHSFTWTEKDRYGREVTRKYSQATIGSMHKNLKAFINDAMVDGYIKENPYSTKRIKIDKGEARTELYLTLEEIKMIEDAKMPTRSLDETRDLFLFACKTALSYADLMEFDYSKVIEIDGIKLYKGKRHKTAISFSSVITKSAVAILEKYNYHLPKVPNQKYNVKLKLVADAAGIDKPISSHWARRSAAMIWLNEGVPMEVVSKILGHTNLTQTAEYAHVLDKTIVKEIKKHIK